MSKLFFWTQLVLYIFLGLTSFLNGYNVVDLDIGITVLVVIILMIMLDLARKTKDNNKVFIIGEAGMFFVGFIIILMFAPKKILTTVEVRFFVGSMYTILITNILLHILAYKKQKLY